MRPDMDDYAELDETKPLAGSRAMSWMVLAIAVGGFAALAYFAYHSGANTINADEMMVVEADGAPMKEAPTTPDGAEFANQDKTIYDVISPNGASQASEKLLPEPERPVAPSNAQPASVQESPAAPTPVVKEVTPVTAPATTTTYVAEPVAATVKPVDTQAAAAATTAALAAAEPVKANSATPVESAPAKPLEKSFSAPQMVNEKPAVKTQAAAPEKAKTESKPKVEKAPVKASAGGAYKLQLGAFKSEAEAEAAWKKISGKYSAVLSGAPTIVKAEVNGGTFYRLRAGSFASVDAAKVACAKLGGQACFPVK